MKQKNMTKREPLATSDSEYNKYQLKYTVNQSNMSFLQEHFLTYNNYNNNYKDNIRL